jgi:uncharacterized protein (DUF952 family)
MAGGPCLQRMPLEHFPAKACPGLVERVPINLIGTRSRLENLHAIRDNQSAAKFGAPLPTTIYKICEDALWREAEGAGMFRGALVDARDGFIHLSTAAQVRETAAKHFEGAEGLMLIAVDADALAGALKWEASRGGDLFPHLYGALPLAAVLWAKPLPLGADRRHVFPELAP